MRGPNPLARAVWGVEPASPRARRRATLVVLGHALIYPCAVGSIFGLFWYLVFPQGGGPSRSEWSIAAMGMATMAAVGTTPVLLLLRLVIGGAGVRLRENRQDYLLTGLTPGQILWGVDAPAIAGLKIAVAVQGCCVALALGWFVTDQPFPGDDWVLIPLIVAVHGSILISLAGGYLLAMGMWLWTLAVLPRVLAVFAFGAATPLLLFLVLAGWFDSMELLEMGIVLEFVFWPVKIGWLVHMYPKVVARLKGDE